MSSPRNLSNVVLDRLLDPGRAMGLLEAQTARKDERAARDGN